MKDDSTVTMGAAPPSAEPRGALESGQQVGHYVVGERIGRGGFGEVWRARHDAIARDVAIKVLHEKYSRDATAVARFVAEAKAANTIDHPNIVQVFDFGALPDGRSYFVMELLRGKSLKQILVERGALPVAEALPILRAIAEAVDAAHEVGLAHRDLKPDNVFVLTDGRVKVIDFGLVKLVGDATEGLTETGVITGTPLYMSPEQFRGKDIGLATDVYSFGALAYHVLVGEPPFVAKDAITVGLMHIQETPVAPSIKRPELGTEIDRWVLALLAKDPEQRPQSLVAALGVAPVEAIESSSTIMKGELSQLSAAPPKPRPRPWLALGAVLVAAASAGVWWIQCRPVVTAITTTPRVQIRCRPIVSHGELSAAQLAAVEQAVPRMTRRALRNTPERRYWLATDDAVGDVVLEVAIELRGETVALHVWRGAAVIAGANGSSFREALSHVVSAVSTELSIGLPTASADDDELAAMAVVKAPSLAAYRRYLAISDQYDQSWWASTDVIIAQLQQLNTDEPRWSRPYALLCTVNGRTKEGCAKELAAEQLHADPTLDPTGHGLMNVVRAGKEMDLRELEKLPDIRVDLEPAASLAQAYLVANRSDDAVALMRQLYHARPDLQYAENLMYVLRLVGRSRDADDVAVEWGRTRPEADQALTTLALVLARHGDIAGGKEALNLRRVLLGEDHNAWVALCDVYLELGDIATARRFVDRLLGDTALQRAFGRFRAGTIAAIEGRFTVAYDTLLRAEVENAPFGGMSESTQVYASLISLAPYVGQPGDLRAELVKLGERFSFDATIHGAVGYETALLDRKPGAACPATERFIDDATESIDHAAVRRRVLRIAASHGCATCAEVVAAGLSESEPSPRSLVAFGRCAEQTHRLGLARDAYERARLIGPMYNESSQFESMIATAHLAEVLRQLGDRDGARRHATLVVERWGDADRALPEVELARHVLSTLDVK